MQKALSYIGGTWVDGDGPVRSRSNPSNLAETVSTWRAVTGEDVASAVRAARDAQPAWAATSPQVRADLLEAVARGILDREQQWAHLLSSEEGKTAAEALGEVRRAAHIFRFFSGEALRVTGDVQASTRESVRVLTEYEPRGVVGIITPWNFPLAIPAWKTAPALAYGNAVVLKPAEVTPACAFMLAREIEQAGFPPGVFNLVLGSGSTVGRALIADPEVDAVTFTGSTPVGRQIALELAARLAPVQLEMGGNNALLIMDDADLDTALSCAIDAGFFSTGQRCTASRRIYVHAARYAEVVDGLRTAVDVLRVGHATDPATRIGPVVDAVQMAEDVSYLDMARSTEGVSVLGGKVLSRDTEGHFLQPAVIVGGRPEHPFVRDEVFGPVVSVHSVDSFDEGLEAVNATEFGLVAGICTQSLRHADRFRAGAEAGMVMVNLPTAGVDPHVSFGGRKQSSFGPKEQGRRAIEFFTEVKVSYVLS